MFCKHCGKKNPEGAHYCVNDGMPLGEANENIQAVKETANFCKSCSHKNSSDALYCVACGVSLEKVTEKKSGAGDILSLGTFNKNQKSASTGSAPVIEGGAASKFSVPGLISAAKFAGIAFGILLIVSFIASSMINSALKDILGDGDLVEMFASGMKFVSVTDVLMLSHLAGIEYSITAMGEGISLATTGWIGLFALISAIGLIVVGFLTNRNQPDRSAIERFYTILPIAVVYSAVIAIISTFAGVSMEIQDPTGWFGDVKVEANYQFFTVLIRALILSIIFTTIGSMIGMNSHLKSFGGNMSYGISIQRAAFHSVLGIVTCMILTLVIIGNKSEVKDIKADAGDESYLVDFFLIQSGTYMWNMAHLGSLEFEASEDSESIGAKYSILGGPKADGMDVEESEELATGLEELLGSLWYFFLVPILLHFWAGVAIRKATTGNILYEIAAYAVAFGLVNTAIFHLLKFSVTTSFDEFINVSFGFSSFLTFLFSTVISFGISYAGVVLMNKKSGSDDVVQHQQVSNF
ncbi:zinc ribbon domain-containing protein [Bacillus haimaensis]|uniref:zinc ribbon domain-containing protein n=1 Tax=Bacillus haimaensis TaxID=3160967 RepID=UPI003AA83215